MLFLVFHIGEDRYALEARQVAEVLPLVEIKRIPQAPAGVAGAFVYQGNPVPVLDLSEFATGTPSPRLMSTRIFLAEYAAPDGEKHLLGLIAEKATSAIRRHPEDFVEAGVAVDAAPYLGPVTMEGGKMIQRIEINQLLPGNVREQLFRQPLEIA